MRTIKFRCWDTENKLDDGRNIMWYQDDQCITIGDCYRIGMRDGNILMQFTGLKDKNGKDIYEGDVVTGIVVGGEDYPDSPVTFEDGCFGLTLPDGYGHKYQPCLYEADERSIEVIGNIYEQEATK